MNGISPSVTPPPPRLPWGWVLALCVVSYGLFLPVWLVVQAGWVRRVNGASSAFRWAVANLAMLPIGFLVVVVLAFIADSPDTGEMPERVGSAIALGIVLALYFTAIHKLRGELRAKPFALALDGPRSFLGGPVYLQAKILDFGRGAD